MSYFQKYELKRHTAVHENVSYTCPFCKKVVKRKPSIIKHLRILHKDQEHIWSNGEFIAELKQNVEYSENFEQSESSNTVESGSDEKHHNEKSVSKNNHIDAILNCKTFGYATQPTKNNKQKVKKSKTIKSGTIIVNYMNNINLNDGNNVYMKSLVTNKPNEKHFNTIKINEAIDISMNVPHTDEFLHDKLINNNNYGSLSENIHTLNVIDDRGSNEIYKNVFFSSNTKNCSATTTPNCQFTSNTPPMTPNSIIGLHQLKVVDKNGIEMQTEYDNGDQQKPATTINLVNQANLNSIIDDCFFVEDALNCNVGLHSPFSSDNDVDGFAMNDTNDDCGMNKELLNKFHDRLEEMDEKIDSTDLKAIWNHMLDEDNLNDDIAADDNDENITDSVEENLAENSEFTNITAVK